jgi:hypothetical protein
VQLGDGLKTIEYFDHLLRSEPKNERLPDLGAAVLWMPLIVSAISEPETTRRRACAATCSFRVAVMVRAE